MKLKPITGYPGGKQRYAKKIVNEFPTKYTTYYEPFIGMGAVFLELQPKKAVISDINKDVINVWNAIKNNPIGLIRNLKKYPVINKITFDKIRNALDKNKQLGISRASLYILYTNNSFGNYARVNKEKHTAAYFDNGKQFNRLLTPKSIRNILNISKYLNENNIKIKNNSYEKALNRVKPTDVIYLDPPYITETKTEKNIFYKFEHITDDMIKYLKKGNVFVSNNKVFLDLVDKRKYKVIYFKNSNFFRNNKNLDEILIYKFRNQHGSATIQKQLENRS